MFVGKATNYPKRFHISKYIFLLRHPLRFTNPCQVLSNAEFFPRFFLSQGIRKNVAGIMTVKVLHKEIFFFPISPLKGIRQWMEEAEGWTWSQKGVKACYNNASLLLLLYIFHPRPQPLKIKSRQVGLYNKSLLEFYFPFFSLLFFALYWLPKIIYFPKKNLVQWPFR